MKDGFDSWYRQAYPRVVRAVVVACGQNELARDAASVAFTKAFERWNRVGRMESPTGWTVRVALNDVRRRERRRRRHDELTLLTPRFEPETPSPEQALVVWAAVMQLPTRMREAVALRYVGELSERECADAMGISVGAVSAQLANARSRLRDVLGNEQEEDDERHTGTPA